MAKFMVVMLAVKWMYNSILNMTAFLDFLPHIMEIESLSIINYDRDMKWLSCITYCGSVHTVLGWEWYHLIKFLVQTFNMSWEVLFNMNDDWYNYYDN